MMPLTNGCCNDNMIQHGPLHSQSLFQLVQISDAYFEHLLLQYSPHSVINWILMCQIWRPELRWDKFWECLFLTVQWQHVHDKHFKFKFHKIVQRTYLGPVENVYMILPQIYSGNYVPNFIRIAQVLQKILQKKHFGLFFLDTLYNVQRHVEVLCKCLSE